MPFRLAVILILSMALSTLGAAAQSAQPEFEGPAPAHVSYVEGAVTLEREGRPETAPLNMPLLSGDRLKTIDGRVEVLFGDGSALHLDSRTTLDLQSDDLLRLIDGRLRLNLTGGTAADRSMRRVTYRIDSPAGSIRIGQAGQYRVSILRRGDETQLELAVLRGSGEIFTDEGTTTVQSGERAYASAGLAPSYAYTYNSANWDAFDRWSESRRDTALGVSAQYLPSEVRTYASTFDEEGDWRYQTAYGYVWYPRVASTWRPYYYGRWAHYPRYGWTWIGADRFGWPTHHYGRWGFSAGAWFWIPAPRWAPAYVSWAYAPGYVSWCPLGWNNRPVIAVNYFNVGPGYYSSWRAWTAVGYSHFGRGYVHHRAVHWDRVDRHRYPSFAVGRSAPAARDVAVPRSTVTGQRAAGTARERPAPIRTAGSLASDNGSRAPRTLSAPSPATQGGAVASGARSPRYINRGDAIVRSQTERPSSPVQRPGEFGRAVERTAPAGPARRADAFGAPPAAAQIDRSRDVAVPRSGYITRSPYERGSVAPPGDAREFQTPSRSPQRYDGGAMRERGGVDSRPGPSNDRAVQRQAPAPSAAPAPAATPAPRATPPPNSMPASRGTAVPRSGGGSAAPAAPSGGGSGARAPRGGGRGGR